MTTETPYQKPLPIRTEENAAYWDSAQRHALELPRCTDCGRFRYPPSPNCPRCLSEKVEWQPISGRGSVYSFIIVHQRYDPSFQDDLPYAVAIVELEEGPRLTTNIVECANDEIQIGMPVTLVYDDVSSEFTLPKFKLIRPDDATPQTP